LEHLERESARSIIMSKHPVYTERSEIEALDDRALAAATHSPDPWTVLEVKDEIQLRQAQRFMRGHKTAELKETLWSLQLQENLGYIETLIIEALQREIAERRAFYYATHAPREGYTLEARAHLVMA
jgi:hypothetical protein